MKSLVLKLSRALDEGAGNEAIEFGEDVLIDSIEDVIKEDSFYSLPTNEIVKIVKKSELNDSENLKLLVSKMSEQKGEESVLILNAIEAENLSLDECIGIISSLSHCSICRVVGRLFGDDENLPERDYEHELEALKKENEELKKSLASKPTQLPPQSKQVVSKPAPVQSNPVAAKKEEKPKNIFQSITLKPVKTENKQAAKTPSSRRTTPLKIPTNFQDNILKAADEGNLESIMFLYEQRHVNVETKDDNENTPIINASSNGNLEVVKYLYETCHANAEAENKNGWTSIIAASHYGHLDVVKYLYKTCHAKVGDCAISMASGNGHLEVVKYLYETCHAKVDDCAISNASCKGHLEVVKYLYETCHANVEDKDERRAPVYLAAQYGHLEVVKYLCETCHASLAKCIDVKDDEGNSPLNNAATKGNLDMVKYLYEKCHADVESKNIKGRTPMNNAARSGHLEVVVYLKETCKAKVQQSSILFGGNEKVQNYLKYGELPK